MKKQLAKFALTATLTLAITFTLTACEEKKKQDGADTKATEAASEAGAAATVEKASVATPETETVCGNGGGSVKLLESATDEEGRVYKFEYDKQNRIVKYNFKYPPIKTDDIMTITYNSDDWVTVEIVEAKTLPDKKLPDKKDVTRYVRNGNTITREYTLGTEEFTINKEGYIFRQGYEYKDGNLIKSEDWDMYNTYDDKKSPFSNTNTPKWLLQTLFYMFNPNKNNVLEKHEDNGEGNGDFNYKYEYDREGFPIKVTGDFTTPKRFTYLCGTQAAKAVVAAETTANEPQAVKAVMANFTDTRDGKTYKTTKIGTQTWMAENLNIEIGKFKCYDNKPDNCQKYGRLYDWETAKKACPSGWHLPSKEEWQTLVNFVGGENTGGTKLKATSGWDKNGNGTDNYGFSALPGGRGYSDDYPFNSAGGFGRWWSSSTKNGTDDDVYISELYHYYEGVSWSHHGVKVLLSVRCIKN
jgi:uncharacterized protein (TIGR02145 family)